MLGGLARRRPFAQSPSAPPRLTGSVLDACAALIAETAPTQPPCIRLFRGFPRFGRSRRFHQLRRFRRLRRIPRCPRFPRFPRLRLLGLMGFVGFVGYVGFRQFPRFCSLTGNRPTAFSIRFVRAAPFHVSSRLLLLARDCSLLFAAVG